MKKLITLLLTLIMTISLCACGVSKEAKNVIKSIDSLPEITLESGAILDDVESAYNALTDEEKQQVSNLSALKEAREQYIELERKQKNESILKDLDTRLNDLKNLKATERSDISSAVRQINLLYASLDEDFKEKSEAYGKLDSYIAQSVKNSVNSLTKTDNYAAAAILKEYKDYIRSEEILSLLGEIGLYRCVNDAAYKLNRINSGKVYNITSVNAFCADDMGHKTSYKDGENCIEGTLSISGTNYFGGPYTQKIDLYYTFNIDVEKCSVSSVTGFTY